ncbi:hypothetical protein [Macrococcus capreoli]|uniref:hypothetical protein n=1 Tax=Macrococcus capreoli TaxID=2982690 RepID=UPI0021D5FB3F|nr:hypothetical protein [Macrococcus sp. TMW 2.2395]MCU7556600.1 hypothetical protein [Macrococcus sp. TMW 2.2395]
MIDFDTKVKTAEDARKLTVDGKRKMGIARDVSAKYTESLIMQRIQSEAERGNYCTFIKRTWGNGVEGRRGNFTVDTETEKCVPILPYRLTEDCAVTKSLVECGFTLDYEEDPFGIEVLISWR